MNINNYYLHAIRAKAQYKRAWVIRAFTMAVEAPDDWKKAPDPYRLVRTTAGVGYVNEAGVVEPIEGALVDQPLLSGKSVIYAPQGFFEHWPEGGFTTAGNLLYNSVCRWPTVGGKFGYANGSFKQSSVEKLFAAAMIDDPEDGSAKDPSKVYVSDWLRYGQAIKYMEEFTQVFVWSLTQASVVPNDKVLALKSKLLEENKAQLGDRLVQARIFKTLEDADAAELANDPGAAFVSSAKSKLARRKLTLMYGSEQGLDVGADPLLITQSLHDGLEPQHMVDVMNVSRAGSFDRGSETMLGGVESKWGDRIMTSAMVAGDDCGTTLGYTFTVTPKNIDTAVGRYLMEAKGLRLIDTAEAAKGLLGQSVTMRSPGRCKAGPSTKWCKACLGVKLSANERSLGLAVSAYGSGFLQLSLQSMHAKATVTVRLRVRELMS